MRGKSLRSRAVIRAAVEALEDRRLLAADPVLTEFLAQNTANIQDEDGTFSDWVEIYNPDTVSKDLGGYYLTDDATLLTKWQIPSGTVVPAQKYLLVWASSKNKVDPSKPLHTNFNLGKDGEFLGIVKPDGVTVTSQYAPTFPGQTANISYGIVGTSNFVNPTLAYFSSPTPAAANVGAIVVSDVVFSQERGFYDLAFNLTLSSPTAGASIRYTTDGSAPSATKGTLYSTSIPITTTTNIRAIAYKSGAGNSKVATESYVFLNDVIHQQSDIAGFPGQNTPAKDTGKGSFVHEDTAMDPNIVNSSTYSGVMRQAMTSIPSMIITAPVTDMFGINGFYDGEVEKGTSIELIDPAHPQNNDQINGGAESHSHDRVKRSLMVSFKSDYGPTKWHNNFLRDNDPVGGDTAENDLDDLVLRAGNNRAWTRVFNPDATTFTEDEWYRQSQIAMEGFGSHGTFVHLYLNGVYWGLYNVAERPDENFQETYFGGDQEDYFSVNHDGRTRGDSSTWDSLLNLIATKDLSVAANYQAATKLLDVSEYSDYLILNWFQAQSDWPRNNWFVGNKNGVDGSPVKYFAWDGEWSWDTSSGVNETPHGAWVHPAFRDGSADTSQNARIWRSLKANPDFMTLFADRVYKAIANNGALTDANAIARWDALNNFVSNAVVGESARWGDALKDLGQPTRTRDVDWQREVTNIRSIMQGNDARLLSALRAEGYYPSINPATFNQRGGPVPSGFDVVLANPNSTGTIYYTTDGSDPRLPGGNISSAAKAYSGPIRLLASANIVMRVRSSSTWSAQDAAEFSVSAFSKLRITELMYNPAAPPAPDTTDGDEFEYVEVQNTGSTPLNLNGAKLGGGIDFTFVDITLDAGQYIVIVENATAFAARYGNGINVAGQYDGKLADEGEEITLADKDGNKILDFTYSPTWYPTRTETQGYSLVIIDPLAAPTTWNNKSNWRPSGSVGGSPGAVDVPQTNQAPSVTASGPGSITLPSTASISANVTDDGLPLDGTPSIQWSKFSGPGTVTFGNANLASTIASFSLAGTYVLRATASDGELTGFGDVTVVVNPAQITNAVTSFTLVDSTTDVDLFDIHEGDTINLALLPHKTLNIRANPASASVNSVKFGWDATPGTFSSSFKVESSRPFAIFGDSGGNYNNGSIAKGSHTLSGTPYTQTAASGTAGATLTVHFSVIDVVSPTLPAAPGNFAASAASSTSVKLTWSDLSSNETGFEIQKSLDGTTFTPVTTVGAGVVTYTATGLTADTNYWFRLRSVNSVGPSAWVNAGPVRTPIVNTTVPVVTRLMLINSDSDVDVLELKDGMSITKSQFASLLNFAVRADVNSLTKSVKFAYQTNTSYKTENSAPFAIFGDDSGNYKGQAFKTGTYTISATPYSASSATGTKGATLKVIFKVV